MHTHPLHHVPEEEAEKELTIVHHVLEVEAEKELTIVKKETHSPLAPVPEVEASNVHSCFKHNTCSPLKQKERSKKGL